MSRLGIVCGSLVIVGLLVEFWLVSKLGFRRGEVATQLREATVKSEKALAEFDRASGDLEAAQAKLAALKMGWGYEWTFAPANPSPIQNQGGKLFVTGLGSGTPGLEPQPVTDSNGQAQMAASPMHVFTDNGQGKFIYTGEFVLGIGQSDLGVQTCVLYPTWKVSPQEMASWNFTNRVRIRTQIPPGGRTEIDSLNQTIQRSSEQLTQLNLRTEDQQRLKTDADQALTARRNELLGDPNGADVAERPEFKVGLVEAIEDLEEERNALQVAVDSVRRRKQDAAQNRSELVDRVKELASKASKPVTQVSTTRP